MVLDPFAALAQGLVDFWQARKFQQWVSLGVQIVISMTGAFCVSGGTLMVTTKSFAVGCGTGMISAGIVLGYFVRRHPLLKGMMFVFPQAEADLEMAANLETITRK